MLTNEFLSNAWAVLVLFLIPIGGGIPAGVLLAQARGLDWPVMMILYFISDVVLACVFDSFLWLMSRVKTHSPFMQQFAESFKVSTNKITSKYGLTPGPFALIMVSFGVDPMTGRVATMLAGHGFISGWLLAIAGDMIFFTVIMASTLWLNNILGDGTWTAIIIMAAMFGIPWLVRRGRSAWQKGA